MKRHAISLAILSVLSMRVASVLSEQISADIDMQPSAKISNEISGGHGPNGNLPGHTFDHIFEEGFDCTRIVSPSTNLVTYIVSLPSGPNVVCLQPGTYDLQSSLNMPSNILLQGMGQGDNRDAATLVLAPGVNTDAIKINGKQNVSIRHLKLDGNGTQQIANPPPAGIAINNSGFVDIRDVEITNTARMGVAAVQNSDLTIYGSFIHDMGMANEPAAVGAMYISTDTSSVWIGNNYVIGKNNGPGGDGGIDCYGVDTIHIYNNTIVNTGESSIYTATPGCTNMSIWGNDIYNSNEWAIDITLGAENVFVSNNRIVGTGLAAMVFWQVNNITVQHNTMSGGHSFPPNVPCKSIVLDDVVSVNIDNTNSVDGGPIYCVRN